MILPGRGPMNFLILHDLRCWFLGSNASSMFLPDGGHGDILSPPDSFRLIDWWIGRETGLSV